MSFTVLFPGAYLTPLPLTHPEWDCCCWGYGGGLTLRSNVARVKSSLCGGEGGFYSPHNRGGCLRAGETEVDFYFCAFELIASALHWPKDVWLILLQCKLVGKAQEVCNSLMLDQKLLKTPPWLHVTHPPFSLHEPLCVPGLVNLADVVHLSDTFMVQDNVVVDSSVLGDAPTTRTTLENTYDHILMAPDLSLSVDKVELIKAQQSDCTLVSSLSAASVNRKERSGTYVFDDGVFMRRCSSGHIDSDHNTIRQLSPQVFFLAGIKIRSGSVLPIM